MKEKFYGLKAASMIFCKVYKTDEGKVGRNHKHADTVVAQDLKPGLNAYNRVGSAKYTQWLGGGAKLSKR